MSVVKVWPLVPGLKGFDASGKEIELTPGHPRWMEEQDAAVAEKAGDVQIMAGLDVTQLKQPRTAELEVENPKTKNKTYKRRDIKAE